MFPCQPTGRHLIFCPAGGNTFLHFELLAVMWEQLAMLYVNITGVLISSLPSHTNSRRTIIQNNGGYNSNINGHSN